MRADQVRQRAARCGGFTLLEVAVALAILAFAMVPLARLQSGQSRGAALAHERSEAAALAEDRIEALRMQVAGSGTEGLAPLVEVIDSEQGARYTRNSSISAAAPDLPGLLVLDVSITWLDRDGVVQEARLVTQAIALTAAAEDLPAGGKRYLTGP